MSLALKLAAFFGALAALRVCDFLVGRYHYAPVSSELGYLRNFGPQRPAVAAHRGSRYLTAENTIVGVRAAGTGQGRPAANQTPTPCRAQHTAAWNLGADVLEMDVRRTADGALVGSMAMHGGGRARAEARGNA